MKNNIVLIAILALMVGGGAGFFGGKEYQKNQRPSFSARGGSALGRGNGMRNGNGAIGTILNIDANSITVKLNDSSSKIVLLTGSTTINKAATGTIADLTVGTTVSAFGTTNADGSVTATNVQINPVMRGPNGPSGTSGNQ